MQNLADPSTLCREAVTGMQSGSLNWDLLGLLDLMFIGFRTGQVSATSRRWCTCSAWVWRILFLWAQRCDVGYYWLHIASQSFLNSVQRSLLLRCWHHKSSTNCTRWLLPGHLTHKRCWRSTPSLQRRACLHLRLRRTVPSMAGTKQRQKRVSGMPFRANWQTHR